MELNCWLVLCVGVLHILWGRTGACGGVGARQYFGLETWVGRQGVLGG